MKEWATRLDSLPRLAWGATVGPGGIRTVVGPWVEVQSTHLVEGVWPGDFGVPGFAEHSSFMGSGLIIESPYQALAVSPAHTTEALYSVSLDTKSFVSNSVALVLQLSGSTLDLDYLDYEVDALSISRGIDHYAEEVPLAAGRVLCVHYYENVRVLPGAVERIAKPAGPTFSRYEDYREFLKAEMKAISTNAQDDARRVKYPPLVFCSRGYDSSACAVLAREIGCEEAVVFESKRGIRVDSGAEIVRALGYTTVHEREELEYLNVARAEQFVSSGELGTSIFFAAAEQELTGKLLVSGVHGDKMWGRDHAESSDERILRSAYPDSAKTEFRLHTGYAIVMPAFFTASSQSQIVELSNSDSMGPWQIGGDYDRPLPRRIVEEAGVPRSAFGQIKDGGAGSSLRFGHLRYLRSVMDATSFARFQSMLPNLKRDRRKSPAWYGRSAVYLVYVLTVMANRAGFTLVSRVAQIERWPRAWTCSPFAPSFLFPWAVRQLQATSYRNACDLSANEHAVSD